MQNFALVNNLEEKIILSKNGLSIYDEGADRIIECLTNDGYEAFYVGGCIRNVILNVPIIDYDITTSAPPDEVKRIFSDSVVLDTGIKHGTVSVKSCGSYYEVTTFRQDGNYKDHRHPDSVSFCSDISEDLRRRDFTCNALAYSKNTGLIDYFNGYYDTCNHILKAVGVPEERLQEDSLRILRALRFCSVFDFKVDEQTASAMKKCRFLIKNISRERIYSEIIKTFSGAYLYKAVLPFGDIIDVAFDGDGVNSTLYEDAIMLADRCAASPKLRLVAFCFSYFSKDYGKFNRICRFLKVDSYFSVLGKTIFECTIFFINSVIDSYSAKKLLSFLGEFRNEFMIFIKEFSSFDSVLIKKYTTLLLHFDSIERRGECYKLSMLNINGNDLITEGFYGKNIGSVLSSCLDEVMKGNLANDKKTLLSYARSYKENNG